MSPVPEHSDMAADELACVEALGPGTLRRLLLEATGRALERGALHSIATESVRFEAGGVTWLVRILANLQRKAQARAAQAGGAAPANPFLPPEPDLLVTGLTPTHRAVLNKFNVVEHHLLVVTRAFEDQERLLTPADFEALWLCLGEYPSLGFYNGGAAAGASQRHRHLQLVPLPLDAAGAALPLMPLLETAAYREGIGSVAALPYRHAMARLDDLRELKPGAAAGPLHERYSRLLAATGIHGEGPEAMQSRPYNLLVARDWMLLVPRSREFWEGMSVNALGYAGALLVRDQEQLRRLREAGPLEALAAVGVGKKPEKNE
jgi:ATP adenylyltransferase